VTVVVIEVVVTVRSDALCAPPEVSEVPLALATQPLEGKVARRNERASGVRIWIGPEGGGAVVVPAVAPAW